MKTVKLTIATLSLLTMIACLDTNSAYYALSVDETDIVLDAAAGDSHTATLYFTSSWTLASFPEDSWLKASPMSGVAKIESAIDSVKIVFTTILPNETEKQRSEAVRFTINAADIALQFPVIQDIVKIE